MDYLTPEQKKTIDAMQRIPARPKFDPATEAAMQARNQGQITATQQALKEGNYGRALGAAIGAPDLGAMIFSRPPDTQPAPAPAPKAAPAATVADPNTTGSTRAAPARAAGMGALAGLPGMLGASQSYRVPQEAADGSRSGETTVRVHYPGDRTNYQQLDSMARYMGAMNLNRGRQPTGNDIIASMYAEAVRKAALGLPTEREQLAFVMDRLGKFSGRNALPFMQAPIPEE